MISTVFGIVSGWILRYAIRHESEARSMSVFDQIRGRGPWSSSRIETFVTETVIPMRLSCVASTGYPLVTSLWFLWQDDYFWCAVQAHSRVAAHCRRNNRCGFEIAGDQPPYRGVRGLADVAIVPEAGERVLRGCIARYLGDEQSDLAQWLLGRVSTEVALRIEPRRIFSWDYSGRMKSAPTA